MIDLWYRLKATRTSPKPFSLALCLQWVTRRTKREASCQSSGPELSKRCVTLHPKPSTLHPSPSTPHPPPHTLHPTPYTLHPTPYTLHPTPYTLHPTLCTLHPTPYTLHPAPELSKRYVPSGTRYYCHVRNKYRPLSGRFTSYYRHVPKTHLKRHNPRDQSCQRGAHARPLVRICINLILIISRGSTYNL